MSIPRTDLYWKYVVKTDQCWLWVGAKTPKGYGVFSRSSGGVSAYYYAHRAAYEMETGEKPGELNVCHSCDNPGCVNPSHLFLGSWTENMKDKVSKNRQAKGEAFHRKLTDLKVKEIRERYEHGETQRALATKFDVDPSLVSRVVNRRYWAHV